MMVRRAALAALVLWRIRSLSKRSSVAVEAMLRLLSRRYELAAGMLTRAVLEMFRPARLWFALSVRTALPEALTVRFFPPSVPRLGSSLAAPPWMLNVLLPEPALRES